MNCFTHGSSCLSRGLNSSIDMETYITFDFSRREGVSGPQGGYSDIFIYTSLSLFGVQNFVFQDFLGFQKNEYFLGREGFVDMFGPSQNCTILGAHFYAF